jgi:DNA-binding transcriptional MerR regulator
MNPMSESQVENIRYFSQDEYNRILEDYSARTNKFNQTECESVLRKHGASPQQAKNGAYVYLHHSGNHGGSLQGTREEYNRHLNEFNAREQAPQQCIQYLESFGYSYGQAKTAVYNYRQDHGLIRKR